MTFEQVLNSRRHLYLLCSKLIDLSQFIEPFERNVCCPFHDDSTPSAKLFNDKDGIQRLFCYSCNRQFTSYDYIVRVLGKDVKETLLGSYSLSELEVHASKMDFSTNKVPLNKSSEEALNAYLEEEDLELLLRKYYNE